MGVKKDTTLMTGLLAAAAVSIGHTPRTPNLVLDLPPRHSKSATVGYVKPARPARTVRERLEKRERRKARMRLRKRRGWR